MGDILLTTPFVRQVRQSFPNAIIDYVIKSQYHDLLKANPNIDTLVVVHPERGYKELKNIHLRLKEATYDYIFDLHNNFRSNYLRRGIHAE
jgi:ADP-heptose:LPS heptosyltransferase